jgi:hypothetical protein
VSGKSHHIKYVLMAALFAGGCQTGAPSTKQAGLDNTGFMSLWNTYTHCRDSSSVSEAYRDMRVLAQATRLRSADEGFVLPLPAKLQQLVTSPASRFAVDVHAMASACSLHAGQLALEQGHVDLARDFFKAVLAFHPREESSYYLAQAKTFLADIERGVDVSLKSP